MSAELAGADLTGANVAGANFNEADVNAATLRGLVGVDDSNLDQARNLAAARRD